jgi:hypothetical protein
MEKGPGIPFNFPGMARPHYPQLNSSISQILDLPTAF